MPTATAPPSNTLMRKALTAPAKAAPRRSVKTNHEGIVRAIVAVTGVVDAVNDLIVPGAFKRTLSIRNPKVVDDHEWGNKAGRTLHIEEWLPGDERLPKQTKEGRPWPAEAGALVATMQYNLRSTRGAESFEWVRFYAETDEAEFSIGYKVPDNKARIRRDGVRVILMLDLFELSHVLFGAAPLSMALEVKGMHAGTAGTHTTTGLAPAARVDDDDLDDLAETPKETDPWEDDEETPRAGMESKTAASVVLEAKTLAEKGGGAENLRKWFVSGAEGAIVWGSPGDFDACVAVASEHMTLEQAKGYCNLRHHDALGIYPATHAAMEGKSAADAVVAAKALAGQLETKDGSMMKGSYEERRDLIRDAAQALLSAPGGPCFEWVNPVATYDTEVIVNACGPGRPDASFVIGYTYDEAAGTVELAEPQEVELSLVAEPKRPGYAPIEEDVAEQAVIKPLMDELERMWGLSMVETKAGERIRTQFEEYAATMSTKAADVEHEGVVEATDDTWTAQKLPEGDWGVYRKTEPIDAIRMDGPFTVQTREGVVESQDGWLALDNDEFPYPIAAEEFDAIYEPVPDEPADEPAADLEAQVETPEVEADLEVKESVAADEEEDDGEMVTINADDHFNAMEALETDAE